MKKERVTPREVRMTPRKARRAIDAIVACLACEEIEGTDEMALEDARAALDKFVVDD